MSGILHAAAVLVAPVALVALVLLFCASGDKKAPPDSAGGESRPLVRTHAALRCLHKRRQRAACVGAARMPRRRVAAPARACLWCAGGSVLSGYAAGCRRQKALHGAQTTRRWPASRSGATPASSSESSPAATPCATRASERAARVSATCERRSDTSRCTALRCAPLRTLAACRVLWHARCRVRRARASDAPATAARVRRSFSFPPASGAAPLSALPASAAARCAARVSARRARL
jgi:hypothetical protein